MPAIKTTRADLLTSIIDPSHRIAAGNQDLGVTTDGESLYPQDEPRQSRSRNVAR